MRYAATLTLLALLSAQATQAAEPDRAFRWASVAYGLGTFADAWTSERGFDAGFIESNPALPRGPTDSRFLAQVALFDGAVYLAARKMHNRRAARWILIGGALVHLTAAWHNDRLYDQAH